MKKRAIYTSVNWLIAAVWLTNGLVCKILGLVPRHQAIIARILGEEHAVEYTRLIGSGEIVMALWIVSALSPKANAITQMVIIAIMNVLEFFLAPDLLLWGRINALFAAIFIFMIWFNEFVLKRKQWPSQD